jgi:alkylation response protein AidB-like acyl-CoA dehydrogenase
LFDPMRPRTGAVRNADGDGWKLHGDKSMVPLGDSAALFLVAAEVRGVGPRLFLVEAGADGLTVEPDRTMGLRAAGLCRLTLDGVEVPDSAMLGEPGQAGFDFGLLVDRARIAWGAMAVGCCQAVLDYAVPYCNERVAFGEPITNRQSVAFMLADIAIELEGMRLLVMRAAALAEQGAPIDGVAAMVREQCARKGMKIGSDGVQLLGGHGFVKDHPVERWYRHLRAVGIAEGMLLP